MRISPREAPTTLLVAVLVTVGFVITGPAAIADGRKPMPSKAEVDAAAQAASNAADDVASAQARLVVANTRLRDAAQRAEMAAEAYNGARWRADQAEQAATQARAAARRTQHRVDAQRAGIAQLVLQSYQHGAGLEQLSVYAGAVDPDQLMQQWGAVNSAGDSLSARYDKFAALAGLAEQQASSAEEARHQAELLAAQAADLRDAAAAAASAAENQAARIAAERKRLIAKLATAQHISVRLAAQRQAALEEIARKKAEAAAKAAAEEAARKQAAAEARRAAEERRRQQQDSGDSGSTGTTTVPVSDTGGSTADTGGSTSAPPASDPGLDQPRGTSSGASAAVSYAQAQLGKPYQWGASGPDSFDCSGLTMMAWRAGGVSLPHYSAAQYSETEHIGLNDLRPGDLVFWGDSPNSIFHVAMYIGDGKIIHAPRTGRDVEIDSLYYWTTPDYFGRP